LPCNQASLLDNILTFIIFLISAHSFVFAGRALVNRAVAPSSSEPKKVYRVYKIELPVGAKKFLKIEGHRISYIMANERDNSCLAQDGSDSCTAVCNNVQAPFCANPPVGCRWTMAPVAVKCFARIQIHH
jgi:hypothetical protein